MRSRRKTPAFHACLGRLTMSEGTPSHSGDAVQGANKLTCECSGDVLL